MHVVRPMSLLVSLLILGASAGASAQTQLGTIEGEITDRTGAVLPGVTVTTTSQERGVSRTTTSDAAGRFRFAAMPTGRYRLTTELSGFRSVTIVDNLVETDKTTEVPIRMEVAQVEAAVNVVGEVPIVDPTNVSVNTRVRAEEFQKLAIGRSYQSLIALVPGVIGTGNVNAHGALTGNNLFLFDGIDTTDPTTGTFGSNLNYEAIQEVSFVTSAASAEYGRAVGAIYNVITKSGTNRFEGSARSSS